MSRRRSPREPAASQVTWDSSNLVMFYDSNDIQLSTRTEAVSAEDTAMKYKAWNWNVITIDGNDLGQIFEALESAEEET